MAKVTRLYEVPAKVGFHRDDTTKETSVEWVYLLIEATSQAAAWKHVAKKYVGAATLPSNKRVAELMGKGAKPETAVED